MLFNCLSPPLSIQSFIYSYIHHPASIPVNNQEDISDGSSRKNAFGHKGGITYGSQLASTAKVSTEQVGRLGEMEVASTTTTATTMNPIAVRQMASVSVKEGGTCSLSLIHSMSNR